MIDSQYFPNLIFTELAIDHPLPASLSKWNSSPIKVTVDKHVQKPIPFTVMDSLKQDFILTINHTSPWPLVLRWKSSPFRAATNTHVQKPIFLDTCDAGLDIGDWSLFSRITLISVNQWKVILRRTLALHSGSTHWSLISLYHFTGVARFSR